MRTYSWEYFNAQFKKSFQNQNKTIYSQSKIDVEPDFGFSLVCPFEG